MDIDRQIAQAVYVASVFVVIPAENFGMDNGSVQEKDLKEVDGF